MGQLSHFKLYTVDKLDLTWADFIEDPLKAFQKIY